MNLQSRRLMVQRLTTAISAIGPDFEDFAATFLDHVLKTPLEHSGLNSFGFPVSRVLDSASDDGMVVAQYSAEENYFDRGMSKASKDINKALARRPGAKRIFLISDEPSRPIIVDDFKKALLSEQRMQGRAITIWGANKVAAWILRHLLVNDAAVDELSVLLPELAEIRDEAARDLLFLALSSRHSPRPKLTAEIGLRLASDPCLAISGLGGCGKSDAAAAFGADMSLSYNQKIWLHRSEFRGVAALQATPLVRGGAKRNVANLLKSRRCLLVIDDPEVDFSKKELADLCGPDSHVIVTVRERSAGDYPLPALLEEEALDILNAGVADPCPDAIFATIWRTVGGHPLSMALMNAAVQDSATWGDIELDCEAVGEFADREQRLADRLLARYRDLLFHELSVFEWIGKPECDADLLKHLIKPVGIRKLNDQAMRAADRPSTVRLHDLVFASLSSVRWWTADRRAQLDNQLEAYLVDRWGRSDLSFWAAAASLRDRLQALAENGDRRPAFLLALLTIMKPEETPRFDVGDPVTSAAAWAASGGPVDPIEFRLVIESFEWLYLHTREGEPGKAITLVEAGLAMYDQLARLPQLTAQQHSEIRHHRGKALAWLKRTAEARVEFEAVMASNHPLKATHLQLMRAYKAERAFHQAIELGEPVMDAAEKGSDVSPSVLLAVMQTMPWQIEETRKRVLRPREAFIKKTIIRYANLGYNQAYETLAAVARYWSTEAPDILAEVLNAIPSPSIEQFDDDATRCDMADILFEYGRSLGSDSNDTYDLALGFFHAAKHLKPFHVQRRAELLIDMDRASEAEAILRAKDDLETNCWVQRLLARALLRLGQASEALDWIDRARNDPKCQSRYHEFHELRFEIGRALGNVDAVKDLREACRLAPEGAIRDRLEALRTSLGDQ